MTDLGDFEEFDDADALDEYEADVDESGTTEADGHGQGTAQAADGGTRSETASSAESPSRFERADISAAGSDTGIGTLSAAEGLVIAEDERETRLRAYITVDNRRQVRIGSYVLAEYPDGERLFARVSALEYAQEFKSDDATEIHARRAMRRDSVDEQDYKFMTSLDPIGILYPEGEELRRRMADRVPRPETVVRQSADPSEIKTGLKIPESGAFLGHLAVGGEKVRTAAAPPTIDYRLNDDYETGDPLIFRHLLIAGGTGSGKTHAAKNVLRQYLDGRTYPVDDRAVEPAVVMFDPQDEYAQMHDSNPQLSEEFARQCDREDIAHGGLEETLAFVPAVGDAVYAASDHRAEQVEFTIPFSMVKARPWLVASGGLNDNQYPALEQLLARFFNADGPDTYAGFQEFLDDTALREKLDESGLIHEATYGAVRRRTQGFGAVFDQDARAITDMVDRFVRPGGLTVVPTYHLSNSRHATTIVLAVASLLIDQKLSNNAYHSTIKETPLLLGMDEAHNFLIDAESVQARKVIGKFTEAAKQGRKERLGLFLITQDPQDIAAPIFKQVNSTVVLNLGDEDAIKAVNIPSSIEGKVPYMEKGQMVVHSPDNSEPVEIMGLPHCLVRHGRD